MRTKSRRALALATLCAVAGVAVWSVRSEAALPPQYDRWNEFAAVLSDSSIPAKLGVTNLVDRIERVGELAYLVHAGKCSVAVTLAKRAPTGPQGQPMAGGAVISIAETGAPRCD